MVSFPSVDLVLEGIGSHKRETNEKMYSLKGLTIGLIKKNPLSFLLKVFSIS